MDHASTQTPATDGPLAARQAILAGETAVTLTSAATLQSLGVGVTPLGSATVDASGAAPVAEFPITGGTAGPGVEGAVVLHQGSGLELAAGTDTVSLRDFRIDTRNGVVNANVAVNGQAAGNAAVFSLGADGATLNLTPLAAEVLGQAFETTAITTAVVIGTAAASPVTDPSAIPSLPVADTSPILGGETAVTLTSAATLQSLGIGVAPLGSAMVDASGAAPMAEFPITGGTAGPGADLVILHQGSGLELASGTVSVDLSDFLIDTRNGVVNANVAVDGEAVGNVAVFSLGADGATLGLTSLAADALDQAFGTTAFEPGLEIGIAVPSPDIGTSGGQPGAPGDRIDWDALAAQVTANFAATGQWFAPGAPAPQPPVEWDALAAQVVANFAATGQWFL